MKTYNLISFLIAMSFGLFTLIGCAEGDDFDYGKTVVFITGTETTPVKKFVVEDTPSTYAITASATNQVSQDVQVKFAIDNSLVENYNKEHNTNYYAIPEGAAVIEDTDALIQSGKSFSTPAVVKVVSTENFAEGRVYVIPVTMTQVNGLDVLQSSKTIFLQISRVIHFTSLNISNTNLYSNFIFADDKKQELSNFTYEIKFYSDDWHTIARLCSFTSKDEQRSSMLRFGENGQAVNALQWVSPTGSIVSTTLFSTGRWYTVSLTYDGSKLTMYVNGVKDAEGAGDGKSVDFQRFELGMSWTGYRSSQYFHGRISEVRVWSRALKPAEMQMGLCGVDPKSDGLLAYWKMNEGEGHIFKDATGHGYDMDWTNTAREINEGAGLTYNLDYSSAIGWDSDDKNKCNQ
ncbi:MAG: hypothetical protein H6Q13_1029 [Bacteroidetes bacterium]|nr:hypothetical protein [Bacteroidota bacterium]